MSEADCHGPLGLGDGTLFSGERRRPPARGTD